MSLSVLLAAVLALALLGYFGGRRRALASAGGSRRPLHSLPAYHGLYVFLWTLLPSLIVAGAILAFRDPIIEWMVRGSLPPGIAERDAQSVDLFLSDIRRIAGGGQVIGEVSEIQQQVADHYSRLQRWAGWIVVPLIVLPALAGLGLTYGRIGPNLRARNRVERIIGALLILCSVVAILTTIGIVLSVLFEALRFFGRVPPSEFFLGLQWSPQTAIRADQVGSPGSFGSIPLFTGTLLIMVIAMAVAVPLGLLSAIYLSEYAAPRVRSTVKPAVEVLAGIPTVVYGFFAALIVAPFLSNLGNRLGLEVGAQSALAAGTVMGIMIVPFVSSLADDVINAVPQKLRNGAYAMGATQGETIRKVVLPAALPGIVGAVLLAISRAIGETMIVLMAAGLFANLTFNPLDTVTTVTVQIATLLTGDQRFDSATTLSAFALGLVLFFATLGLNIIALKVTQRYREKYD